MKSLHHRTLRCFCFAAIGFARCAEVVAAEYHADLTVYRDEGGATRPIRGRRDFDRRRDQIRAGLQEAMGPMPDLKTLPPLDVQVLSEERVGGITRRKLAYCTDRADQRVGAWLLIPDKARTRPAPAMLCLHQTTRPGKDQPVGLADRPTLHYALELSRRGYVTLSPDYPSLGESKHDFDADAYVSGSMKAIVDNRRALDLLGSLPEVDATRIGGIGHSLGGHNALFTAVFDERLRAVVTCCGFTAAARYMGGDLTGWSGPRYMPRIAAMYGCSPQRIPFDFHEVVAAIAPRAVFVVAPLADDNFDVVGVREVIAAARPVFELYNRGAMLQVVYPECGHDFPDDCRKQAYEFLDEALRTN